MRVPSYNQQTTINAQPTTRIQPVADQNAFGANVAQAQDRMADAINTMSKVDTQLILEKQAKENTQAVFDAKTKYLQDIQNSFYNSESGLFNRKGEQAISKPGANGQPGQLGVAADGSAMLTQIQKKYADSLTNNAQKVAFLQYTTDTNQSYQKLAMQHEHEQTEIAFKNSYASNLEANKQSAISAYTNVDLANTFLRNSMQATEAFGKRQGLTPEQIKVQNSSNMNEIVGTMVKTAIFNKDYAQAENLIGYYSDKLHAKDKAELLGVIKPEKQKVEDEFWVDDMSRNPAFLNSDGSPNVAAMREANKAKYLNKTKTITVPGADSGQSIVQEGLKQKGKAYQLGADGIDKTDCGKFTQDVFANKGIDLGTRTADGQYSKLEEAKKTFTDSNQLKAGDLVFWHVPGNEDKWATSNDKSAVNSDDKAYKGITHVGIYSGDGKVLQAGSSGVGTIDMDTYQVVGFGRATSAEGNTQTVADPDYDRYKQNESRIEHFNAVWQNQRASATKQKVNAFSSWADENTGASYDQIRSAGVSIGLSGAELDSAVSHVMSKINSGINFDRAIENRALEEMKDDITAGNIKNPEQLIAKYGGKVSATKIAIIGESYKSFVDPTFKEPPELQAKMGEDALAAGIADAGLTVVAFKGREDEEGSFLGAKMKIRQKVTVMINDARKNGSTVTPDDIRAWSRAQATKTIVDGKGNEDYLFKVPSGSVYVPGKGFGKPIE